jgi:acyl CoA:acetate/3-ketoacid CoA transferase beta subunit
MDVTPTGLLLRELAPGVRMSEVRDATEADFNVAGDLCVMAV